MSHLIVIPVLLPLLTGLLLLLIDGCKIRLLRAISLASTLALVAVSVALVATADTGAIGVYALGNWEPPYGIVLVLDRLAALMVLLTAVLALASLCYASRSTIANEDNLHCLTHFLLMGLNGAFLTGDLFNLFVFFEVLLLASYALLLHGGGPARAKAGLHYVVLNLTGSSLFLIAVAVLYGLTGTLNMADMAVRVMLIEPADAALVKTAALLLLLVFGLKAAIVPLYFWLPRAYASASAPVAAMFAIMTKLGIYAMIRVYSLVFGDTAGSIANLAKPWLWPLGLTTLVLGFIGILAARNLRIQIAYLLIVSVGTLTVGVALHTQEALSATLYYLVHSTLICGALFLLADVISQQRGEARDLIVSGPAPRQPVLLGSLFFIAAVSVVGLPPLSGFVGKALLLKAAGTGTEAAWLWAAVLASSLAALTALSRSGSTIFWRTTGGPPGPMDADRWAVVTLIALLSLGPVLVVWGNPVMQYTDALAEQIMTPHRYIHAVLNHVTVQGE